MAFIASEPDDGIIKQGVYPHAAQFVATAPALHCPAPTHDHEFRKTIRLHLDDIQYQLHYPR
jgi:hypothetical protein